MGKWDALRSQIEVEVAQPIDVLIERGGILLDTHPAFRPLKPVILYKKGATRRGVATKGLIEKARTEATQETLDAVAEGAHNPTPTPPMCGRPDPIGRPPALDTRAA